MNKPIAWSYSALVNYQTCPKQFHEVRVLKNYKEQSEQQLWGNEVHEAIHKALVSGHPLGGPFAAYAGIVERFRKTKGVLAPEQQLAITSAFKPTGWFAADVWCRGIIDALWIDKSIARMVDWKTGRRKPDSQQLQLFALLVFAHHPEVTHVRSAFVWLQNGAMDVLLYNRRDIAHLWQDVLPAVQRLERAFKTDTWTPKPSGLCKGWCPVKTCSFWDGAKVEQLRAAAGVIV